MDYGQYSPEGISPIDQGFGNLETLNYVAQSMKEQVSKERERFRALESQAQKIRSEAYHRIRSYEQRIAELQKELETARHHAKAAGDGVKDYQRKAADTIKAQTQRITSLQGEMRALQAKVATLNAELAKARQASTSLQAERDAIAQASQAIQQSQSASTQELRDLKARNEELNRKIREATDAREAVAREARDLREHTLRQLTQEFSELKRRIEGSATGTEIRDLVEKQLVPAYQRLHSEIQQSERRGHMDLERTTAKISQDMTQLGEKFDAIDRLQANVTENDRKVRKEVAKLRDQMHEFIQRLGFLDSTSGDFNRLNQQVVRIEKSLAASERAMAQISYLLQAVGKQQEQANDLFLNHTENFLKKQMAGFRQTIQECLSDNQREMQKFVRKCFRDMADGNYDFDDENAANGYSIREAGPAYESGSASEPILAGPPPGVTPPPRPAALAAEVNKAEHLRSLLEKKNDEIRQTDEKLAQTDPATDAYQKLSLVKELLRTQRAHISRLTEKLAPRVDSNGEIRTPDAEA